MRILLVDDEEVSRELVADFLVEQLGYEVVQAADGLAAGFPVESTPNSPDDASAIDYLFFVHDRHDGNREAARRYLAWETGLVAQLDAPARVFFCNSGAEANEAAFKISRLTGRTKIVAAQGAFHGRTMGSLALTGQPGKQEPFLPLPGDVTHVPYGDADALEAAVTDETAAVFLEPIMGEGGVVTPPLAQLETLDLVPYQSLTTRKPVAVMVGHMQVPGLTDTDPASLSKAAYDLLRSGDYGGRPFTGPVFTDDLSSMGAITQRYSVPEAVLKALLGKEHLLWQDKLNHASLQEMGSQLP